MIDVRWLQDQFRYLWGRRGTRRGLLIFILLLNATLFSMLPFVSMFINNTTILNTAGQWLWFIVIYVGILGAANLFLLMLWAYWHSTPQARPGEVTVYFAPRAVSEAEDIVYKLYDSFSDRLHALDLVGFVTHSLVPKGIIIKNHREAHEFLNRTGGMVVIHGAIGRGRLRGRETEGFQEICFTVRHRVLQKGEVESIARDVAGAGLLRAYNIMQDDTFLGYDLVAKNLTEVATYLASLALALNGEVDRAREILETLLIRVKEIRGASIRSPQFRLFHQSIVNTLIFSLRCCYIQLYEDEVVDSITDRRADQAARTCEQYLSRIDTLRGDHRSTAMEMAIISFHFGLLKAVAGSGQGGV